jgi:hypothetical protein
MMIGDAMVHFGPENVSILFQILACYQSVPLILWWVGDGGVGWGVLALGWVGISASDNHHLISLLPSIVQIIT